MRNREDAEDALQDGLSLLFEIGKVWKAIHNSRPG